MKLLIRSFQTWPHSRWEQLDEHDGTKKKKDVILMCLIELFIGVFSLVCTVMLRTLIAKVIKFGQTLNGYSRKHTLTAFQNESPLVMHPLKCLGETWCYLN